MTKDLEVCYREFPFLQVSSLKYTSTVFVLKNDVFPETVLKSSDEFTK